MCRLKVVRAPAWNLYYGSWPWIHDIDFLNAMFSSLRGLPVSFLPTSDRFRILSRVSLCEAYLCKDAISDERLRGQDSEPDYCKNGLSRPSCYVVGPSQLDGRGGQGRLRLWRRHELVMHSGNH